MRRNDRHILSVFEQVARERELRIVEEIVIPPRREQRHRLPPRLLASRTGRHLLRTAAPKGTLWRHQSLALAAFEEGRDVAITTSTASGKSLVFQSAGTYLLESAPDSRIVVFYPLKALAGDQMAPWRKAMEGAGLDPASVVEITGDVPTAERAALLAEARVVALTPDVTHAWMMGNLGDPVIRRFVSEIGMVVLDEAHVYESVFGSSVAYLLRRLEAAHALAGGEPFRYIAASATVDGPEEHLRTLTGREFLVIDDLEDGSPRHGRRILHMAPKTDAAMDLVEMQRLLVDRSGRGSFISFVDSRMGVEKLALSTNSGDVSPYRNGYERSDRGRIEQNLKSGRLRGVVSTSALEMGIDISEFALGINIGIPSSRRSLRQRMGRVGRSSPGVFAVLCEADEFVRFGETFRDYVSGEVEPCTLYLDNRFLQFAHARCLRAELRAMGGRLELPGGARSWPEGFAAMFAEAGSPGKVSPEFERIASLDTGKPHYGYPLRDIGDGGYRITLDDGTTIGRATLRNAITEAYPGAVYLSMAKAFEITGWGEDRWGQPEIHAAPAQSRRTTKPILRNYASFGLDADGVVDGNLEAGPSGFMAEVKLKVVERVEGFKVSDIPHLYSELSRFDPSKTAKSRPFRTTGVVFRFATGFGRDPSVLQEISSALVHKLKRSEAIAGQDIGSSVTDITLELPGLVAHLEDAIVIFDKTYGSLRLTEPLFAGVSGYLDDLAIGGVLSETGRAVLPPAVLSGLRAWKTGLVESTPEAARLATLVSLGIDPGRPFRVLPAGTVVRSTTGIDMTIREHVVVVKAGAVSVSYRMAAPDGRSALVADSALHSTAERVAWSPIAV